MNDWLKEIKKEIGKFHKTEYAKISDGRINQRVIAREFSLGRKMSNESKNKLSKALSNKPKSKSHIATLKKTKLRYKISKEQILQAQIGTTTAQQVADKLGITFNTYKAVATYHKVYKKQSLSQRNKDISSKPVLCWTYDTEKYIGEYYSVSEAARQLNVASPNIISVCKGLYKQCKGYYFEYKN
jgi:hypothetical protein